MIIKRGRSHKTNMSNYESLDTWVSVEVDADSPDYADMDAEELSAEINSTLDALLDSEIDRVVSLPGIIQESHVFDFYEKD